MTHPEPPLPGATVERLPRYLEILERLPSDRCTISSDELARLAGVTPAQLRKDLSFLGAHGTRGVGYDRSTLTARIASALGRSTERRIVIVGAGNLGRALANYGGFASHGFRIVGIYDKDPTKVGTRVDGLVVRSMEDLMRDIGEEGIEIGIVATPAEAASSVAELLVRHGVKAILNFAPAALELPPDIPVRHVDLATELQVLGYHLTRRDGRADEGRASA